MRIVIHLLLNGLCVLVALVSASLALAQTPAGKIQAPAGKIQAPNGKIENAKTYAQPLADDEHWWGGLSSDGNVMPYTKATLLDRNQYANNYGNQAQPLLISSSGRYVWSESPLRYSFKQGRLEVSATDGDLQVGLAGESLKSAYQAAARQFFPPQDTHPDPLLFSAPQYNTWIELVYDQNEKDILAYAQAIIDNGYPPGVLMIDDNWQEDYGTFEFSARRFQNPKAMVERLHAMGFKVMLWVCPFVSADSAVGRQLTKEKMLLMEPRQSKPGGEVVSKRGVAMIRWWNGTSALLDLSKPNARRWFEQQLDYLTTEYGIDGFKLDAGDSRYYLPSEVELNGEHPNRHTQFFAEIGLKYPLNEYRASWKMAGYPLAQRLRDKLHTWEDLQALVPGILAQGMMGYAFVCPDMIGGGDFVSFKDQSKLDEELIVRSAQVHALMPMMQFSVAPWRVLNAKNAAICQRMAKLHRQFGDRIVGLAQQSATTGDPIAKPLDWYWPGQGYGGVVDQFMLGDNLLVAPVTKLGARERSVAIPPGKWKADDGKIYEGPSTTLVPAPLTRLPYFERI